MYIACIVDVHNLTKTELSHLSGVLVLKCLPPHVQLIPILDYKRAHTIEKKTSSVEELEGDADCSSSVCK
jgi:hypothetical protein